VEKIRRYYNILKWKDAEIKRVVQQQSLENNEGESKVLSIINSPVL
jgi:hypothetical protein